MPKYIGIAKGHLAWVHLRNGDLLSACKGAREGVEKLRGTPQGHILLWVALWPLIGVEMAHGKSADAVEHAETLLIPPQMAIPTDLEKALRSAVNAWKENDPVTADHHLKKAADLAKKIGYL